MRIALFIILFFISLVPRAFSDSLWSSRSPEKSSQAFEHDWSGFYAGLLLGGQFGKSTDQTGTFGYNADNDKWDYNQSGVDAAADFGYNYPWQNFIIGPEIELGYLNMAGSGAQPASPGPDTIGKTSSDFYMTIRARAGIDFQRNLLFVTGGAIAANYNEKIIDSCNIAPCGGGTVNAKNTDFILGYTVGAGVEHMFTNNWSVKLEYLYFNLPNQGFNGTTNLGNTYYWTGKTYGNIIRGGVNYSF